MKALIGCETSGKVRDALIRLGWDAMSCDLLPSDVAGPHYQGDILDIINDHSFARFDLFICHPPCTYLTVAAEWAYRDHQTKNIKPGTLIGAARRKAREEAVDFAKKLWKAKVDSICMENPVGCLSTHIGKPNQIIQPYQFGHDASKKTCLWVKNLPLLAGTAYVEPRWVDGKPRWANQTDSGQNRLPPSEDRWKVRSETYQGVADAMADQYTAYLSSINQQSLFSSIAA
ncbi:hypothetical protein CLV58_12528 [Spirosoma oryzae]|uniref:DNA (Cytosine-5)-methyltransferase 1 n=1 Tax=Spirosoma oryzae TaxID=1469603 RepID=A0A2T0S8Q1_9BACT|nr:hypothetical protein [Spirosoma oryzae]PRY29766.1 hypothetical protein CLV58_12528 [Spirosoma oryzae]